MTLSGCACGWSSARGTVAPSTWAQWKEEGTVCNVLDWSVVWQELRENLVKQPPCPDHPEYPHVRTLVRHVINDVIEVCEHEICVRSHLTSHPDPIKAGRFKIWWDHLVAKGSASLSPGDPNCPHPWRSCIVGAIIATCLPHRIRVVSPSTIELFQQDC